MRVANSAGPLQERDSLSVDRPVRVFFGVSSSGTALSKSGPDLIGSTPHLLSAQFSSPITLSGNNPPVAFDQAITIQEDQMTSITLEGESADSTA